MVIIFNLQALIVGIIGIIIGTLLNTIKIIPFSDEAYLIIGIMISSLIAEFKGFTPKLFFIPLGFISIILNIIILNDEIGSISLAITIPLLITYIGMKLNSISIDLEKK